MADRKRSVSKAQMEVLRRMADDTHELFWRGGKYWLSPVDGHGTRVTEVSPQTMAALDRRGCISAFHEKYRENDDQYELTPAGRALVEVSRGR